MAAEEASRGMVRPSVNESNPLPFAWLRMTGLLKWTFGVGRSSFAPPSGATARQVSACHAEAVGVGGLDVCFLGIILSFELVELIDVGRPIVAVNGNNERETNGCFGGGDSD